LPGRAGYGHCAAAEAAARISGRQGEEEQTMSDEELENAPRTYSGALLAVIGIALVAAIAGLIWSYTLTGRLTRQEAAMAEANQRNASLEADLRETNARLKVATEELGNSLGLTQKQMDARAQELVRREQADAARLANQQKLTEQQVSAVTSDVSAVKTDVGGVKTDLGQTKTELQTAEAQLQSMKGDLGVQSGLIATNHSELEILKHKGDRNYYEFTLNKNERKAVSTVGLELKKADTKHSRYTLEVYADDKKIEKKDRGLNEPVQFYTGKDNMLYELVVNSINKNQVQGYVSTPKNAPVPVSTTPGQ
jgi:hypothetical protein